jgi:dipeptidyl aminopeptidase/acylaminoacyl peptidase
MRPFVLEPQPVTPVRETNLDLYLPAGNQPAAAVVFVHGGPVPIDRRPTPRDWPVYQGYGSAAAARGLVAATFDHRFHDFDLIRQAGEDIATAVDRVRAHPRVDPDRIAMWFFSGGGILMGNCLSQPPSWLRCVAASYPICPTQEELEDVAISPDEALRKAGELPILLTRVGQEQPDVAQAVDAFVAAAAEAGANLEVIDVPDGHHGFDTVDHTDQSRAAVERALDWVTSRLRDDALTR